MSGGPAMLELSDVHAYYGNIRALKGVSLTVDRGEIVTLIGSNGAGKTTALKTVIGTVRPLRGTVSLNGARIDTVPTHRIVRLGIAQAPEGRRIFGRMSVLENLELGAFARVDREAVPQDLERVLALFPRLAERLGQKGGTLSGGEQQMLAIGRALMSRPRLLLLDEPSLGLAPMVVAEMLRTIRVLSQEKGMTVLLVEQNVAASLKLAEHAYVLENGRIVMQGRGEDLLHDDRVRQAYLGL